jgi:hypothetical protein
MQQIPINDYIPTNPADIRQTPLFAQLYSLIQFQRDQYLVGREYAEWQQKERRIVAKESAPSNSSSSSSSSFVGFASNLATFTNKNIETSNNDGLPVDPTALGHAQLARIAADFVPSETVRRALLPLVTPLPLPPSLSSPSSPSLYPLIQRATVQQGILAQQGLLNRVTHRAILNFLQNPRNRVAIKQSTYGFIETKYSSDA